MKKAVLLWLASFGELNSLGNNMANKLDVETLNRLRGIGGSRNETAEKDKLAEKNEPQKTPSKPVDPEKTAALNNFLNSVPDNPVPDSERK